MLLVLIRISEVILMSTKTTYVFYGELSKIIF